MTKLSETYISRDTRLIVFHTSTGTVIYEGQLDLAQRKVDIWTRISIDSHCWYNFTLRIASQNVEMKIKSAVQISSRVIKGIANEKVTRVNRPVLCISLKIQVCTSNCTLESYYKNQQTVGRCWKFVL